MVNCGAVLPACPLDLKLDRIASDSGKKLLVFTVGPNPEPHHATLPQNADRSPIAIDADEVDRKRGVYLLEPKRRMRRIRRPHLVGSNCLFSNGSGSRFEKLSKPLRRLRLHPLERLCLTGGVLGQRFFCELREQILRICEG